MAYSTKDFENILVHIHKNGIFKFQNIKFLDCFSSAETVSPSQIYKRTSFIIQVYTK